MSVIDTGRSEPSTAISEPRPALRAVTQKVPHPARLATLVVVVTLLALFFLWPLIDILFRSLSAAGTVSYLHPSVTWSNYSALWHDELLRIVIRNTLSLALWSTLVTLLLAYPSAYLLSRLRRRHANVVLALIAVPFLVSILVRLFAFTELLSTDGLVNQALGVVHLGPYKILFTTPAVVIGTVNYLLPYMIFILYASMSTVDGSLAVAARSLGASNAQIFRRIFFPLTKNALVSGTILTFVLALGFFLTPVILGGPQDTTVAAYIEEQIQLFQWGYASAVGILLFVVTTACYVIAIRISGITSLVGRPGVSQKGAAAEPEPVGRGPLAIVLWAAMALTLVILLVPLVIVIPISFEKSQVITFPPQGFTFSWYHVVLSQPMWTSAIWKSTRVGLTVAVIATALGLGLARLLQGWRSARAVTAIQTVVYAPLVVPIILLAIGIFDVETRLSLNGAFWGLVLPHVVMALPFTFVTCTAAIAGLDPVLEEAAWTLGVSRTRAFYSVVLRPIVPSIIGAMFLGFIISWDDVVIALFQTGQQPTLPVTIFSFLQSGVQPSVAAIATLLIALVVVGMAAMQLTNRRARTRRVPLATDG
jgi:putative spermidine/putrescine transport system permease protein